MDILQHVDPATIIYPADLGTPESLDENMLYTSYDDPDSRWRAVLTRDPAADCAFVYCVRTTKVYCRPVCKARLARRANVVFYDFPWDAEAAGFRACKRCKPDLIDLMPENEAVGKIRNVVDRSVVNGEPLPRADALAEQTGLSKWHLQRQFKRIYGVTPRQFSAAASTALTATSYAGMPPSATSGASGYLTPNSCPGGDFEAALASSVMPTGPA